MSVFRNCILIILISFYINTINAQPLPAKPVSYRIYSPHILNPAIAGSKDFASLNFIAAFQNGPSSQVISVEGRIIKKGNTYFATGRNREFSKIAVGATFFNDLNGISVNKGGAALISWHFPLSRNRLSYISAGVSVKGVFNTLDYGNSEDSLSSRPSKESIFPNLDAGIYYYSKNLFAGFSINNLFGNPGTIDSLGNYEIPVSMKSYLTAGFKVMLLPSMNMVLEPSVLLEFDRYDLGDPGLVVQPMLKLYLEDFCFGMFFYDMDYHSFFFQYRYPGFYLGAYYGIKKNSTYFLNDPLVEIMFGLNLSRKGFRVSRPSHW